MREQFLITLVILKLNVKAYFSSIFAMIRYDCFKLYGGLNRSFEVVLFEWFDVNLLAPNSSYAPEIADGVSYLNISKVVWMADSTPGLSHAKWDAGCLFRVFIA